MASNQSEPERERDWFNYMRFWVAIAIWFDCGLLWFILLARCRRYTAVITVVHLQRTHLFPMHVRRVFSRVLPWFSSSSPTQHSFWSIAIKSKIDWKNSSHGNRFPPLSLALCIGKHFVIDRKSLMKKSATSALLPFYSYSHSQRIRFGYGPPHEKKQKLVGEKIAAIATSISDRIIMLALETMNGCDAPPRRLRTMPSLNTEKSNGRRNMKLSNGIKKIFSAFRTWMELGAIKRTYFILKWTYFQFY